MNLPTSLPSPVPPAAPSRRSLLQAGLDLIDQGFTVFDADLHLVAWNRAFMRLLDFPDHLAFEGASFESFIRYNAQRGEYGSEDPERHIAARVAAAHSFAPHDLERVRPDGRVLRVVGQPLPGHGFVTLYSDITEQRRAESVIREQNASLERRVAERTEALHRSEQQMRLITDSIPALVAYVDASRSYRYVNRGYREWFRLDPSRPGAISAREFLGAATYEGIKDHVARAFAGNAVSFAYELDRVDGSRVRVRTSLIPDVAPNGQVAGCFELTFDITEHVRSQELLMRAQKMEALGQLTGGLAHDFNNLLTVIIGNLGLLVEGRGGADTRQGTTQGTTQELAAPALQAARRGAELIRRLLSFARQQPLQARAVQAQQALANVATLVRRSLPQAVDLVLAGAAPGTAPWAWADPAELETALLNLIINARDAMGDQALAEGPAGGQVHLRTSSETLDAEAAARLQLEPGAYVRFDVQDNGCGMDAATRAKVFEPFFTTKPAGVGTGLGLAMVYGFVRQSGGAVDVASAPGEGCTVSLWLPACPPPEDGADTPNADGVRPALAPPQGLALLVEDDAAVREVVRRYLLELGYVVLEADNGVEAQAMLVATPGIVLLLTDVVMPGGVDGRDLGREARDLHGVPQVLLMSGHAPTRADAVGLPLLRKPFSREQLAHALLAVAAPLSAPAPAPAPASALKAAPTPANPGRGSAL